MPIALPTIQKEMNLEPEQLQWSMSAYPLSLVKKTRLLVFPIHFVSIHKDSAHHFNFLHRVACLSYVVG